MRCSGNWPRVCIADICQSIVDCPNRTAPTVNEVTPYKMIRTTNVRHGRIDLSNVKYVDRPTYERWTRRQVPRAGDIILTREAPLGEVGMLKTSDLVFLGQRLVSYRADLDKVDRRFLLYALQSDDVQAQIRAFGSGATVEHMRVPDAKKLMVRVPALATQRRIGSILSAYDDLIENNTRRIVILEEMAERLYQEWFVKFRFPGHESVTLIQSDLGTLPSGWEPTYFTSLAEVQSGGTPKKSAPEFWNGAIPFYTPTDAPRFAYALDTDASITEQGLARCNSQLYPKDTIFITARGTVGKVALASRPMAMNQSCYALRPKMAIGNLYLYHATKAAAAQLRARSHGAVFDTIIVDTFKQLPVIKPSERVISEFERRVKPLFALVLNLLKRTANLHAQRDLLMPKLISSEIDVSQAAEIAQEAVA